MSIANSAICYCYLSGLIDDVAIYTLFFLAPLDNFNESHWRSFQGLILNQTFLLPKADHAVTEN